MENVGRFEFLGNLEAFRAESDEESVSWSAFVLAWSTKFGDQEVGAGDLFDLALPLLDLGTDTKRSQETRLGTILAAQRDRVYGEFTIRRRGINRGRRMWMLDTRA